MINEVDAKTAFEALSTQREAILVDCRTKTEWMLIGTPDLSSVNKQPVLIEWQMIDGRLNDRFCQSVSELADTQTPVYVLCRVGGRSASACQALMDAGFTTVFNIEGGFEGPLNDTGHRSQVDGWKFYQLPWIQS